MTWWPFLVFLAYLAIGVFGIATMESPRPRLRIVGTSCCLAFLAVFVAGLAWLLWVLHDFEAAFPPFD